jgi:hypothetical protein
LGEFPVALIVGGLVKAILGGGGSEGSRFGFGAVPLFVIELLIVGGGGNGKDVGGGGRLPESGWLPSSLFDWSLMMSMVNTAH